MKKVILALVLLFAGYTAASADEIITKSQLPQRAQQFLEKHFSGVKVSYAKYDNEIVSKSYDVVLVNGAKVDFDGKGEWKQVECKKEGVPVAIIPAQIKSYVASNHPDRKVVEIDKDSRGYEVRLSNGLEIKFNKSFKVVEID